MRYDKTSTRIRVRIGIDNDAKSQEEPTSKINTRKLVEEEDVRIIFVCFIFENTNDTIIA